MALDSKKDYRKLQRRQRESPSGSSGSSDSRELAPTSDPRYIRASLALSSGAVPPGRFFDPSSPLGPNPAAFSGQSSPNWSTYPEPESYGPEEVEAIAEAEQEEAYRELYTRQGKSAYLDSDAQLDPAIQRYLRQLTGQAAAFEAADLRDATKLTEPQAKFIQAYISNGGLTHSALATAGATRIMYQQWLKESRFNDALQEATERWFEELRKAAFLRAQAKSDVLLIFLLKALKPETYDDDVRKATWMAKNGLLGSENLPVRASLVRDNTFNVQINHAGPHKAEPSGPMAVSTADLYGPGSQGSQGSPGSPGSQGSPGSGGRTVSLSDISDSDEAAEVAAVAELSGSNVSPVASRAVGTNAVAPRTRAGQERPDEPGDDGDDDAEDSFSIDDL